LHAADDNADSEAIDEGSGERSRFVRERHRQHHRNRGRTEEETGDNSE
jgi:hypothetical protein